MQRLARLFRRSPWLCNVGLYGSLFAAGDAVQQQLRLQPGQRPDWAQTRRVALLALTFHANFNYLWLRGLERLLPGRAPGALLAKVGCDQLLGAPVAILAFYAGMRMLQGKEDIFADCRQKFWNTYKTGLMYWPFVQVSVGFYLGWKMPCGNLPCRFLLSNFRFVPVYLRTAFTGFCGFLWAIFLCFSQQSGDGTATLVFKMFRVEKADPDKTSSGK